MNVDIRDIESLNNVFFKVMGQIFFASASTTTFNEMTGAQRRILYLLDIKGPQKMTQIAHLVGVTVPAATAVVDKLVRAGFVQRDADPGDRRVIHVALTPLGRKTGAKLRRVHEKGLATALAKLLPEKREELILAFEKIHVLLSEIDRPAEKK